MRFFLDENFPKSAVALLEKHRHEVFDIRGTSAEGCADSALFGLAQKAQAVLLTTDRDFFHTIPHTEQDHCGVVVIALHQPNRANILGRLEWLLAYVAERDLRNLVFELRDSTYVVNDPSFRDLGK